MKVTFDPRKDARNAAKHGVSLSLAEQFEWETALIWTDSREDYRGRPAVRHRLCGPALVRGGLRGGCRRAPHHQSAQSEQCRGQALCLVL